MKKVWLAMLLSFLCLGLACAEGASTAKVGSKAPGIKAKEWISAKGPLTSKQVSDKVKGKINVVEFWATWCSPCRKSMPHLVKIYSKYKDKGVVVIGLTQEDRRKANIDKFLREMKINYIIGTGSDSSQKYGVTGIPHAFVISPDGKILWRGHPMSGLDKVIEDAVKKYH